MTGVSGATIVGISTAKGRTRKRPAVLRDATMMPTASASPRVVPIGAQSRDQTRFQVPPKARIVKDIVWLAVISMALAVIAVLVGLIDIFIQANLVPLVLGSGFASLTFSVLGLTDRLSGRS